MIGFYKFFQLPNIFVFLFDLFDQFFVGLADDAGHVLLVAIAVAQRHFLDGVERLQDAGLPANSRFFSDYNMSGRIRRSLAKELYCVRPNQELAVLIEAVRQAIGVK